MPRINPTDYAGVKWLSSKIGVPRQTLSSAIERGEIRCVEFPCGSLLYRIADAEEFARTHTPGRGRRKVKA